MDGLKGKANKEAIQRRQERLIKRTAGARAPLKEDSSEGQAPALDGKNIAALAADKTFLVLSICFSSSSSTSAIKEILIKEKQDQVKENATSLLDFSWNCYPMFHSLRLYFLLYIFPENQFKDMI